MYAPAFIQLPHPDAEAAIIVATDGKDNVLLAVRDSEGDVAAVRLDLLELEVLRLAVTAASKAVVEAKSFTETLSLFDQGEDEVQ